MGRVCTVLILLALVCTGCDMPPEDSQALAGQRYNLVRIRDCDYIYTPWNSAAPPVHAGDCRNPAHRDTTGGR